MRCFPHPRTLISALLRAHNQLVSLEATSCSSNMQGTCRKRGEGKKKKKKKRKEKKIIVQIALRQPSRPPKYFKLSMCCGVQFVNLFGQGRAGAKTGEEFSRAKESAPPGTGLQPNGAWHTFDHLDHSVES